MRAEKLADKVRPPWRMAIVLASVTAGASLATWVGGVMPQRIATAPVEVHIKLRATGAAALDSADENAMASAASVPFFADEDGRATLKALDISALFVDLPDSIHDDRARWLRIRAPSLAEAERWVRAA